MKKQSEQQITTEQFGEALVPYLVDFANTLPEVAAAMAKLRQYQALLDEERSEVVRQIELEFSQVAQHVDDFISKLVASGIIETSIIQQQRYQQMHREIAEHIITFQMFYIRYIEMLVQLEWVPDMESTPLDLRTILLKFEKKGPNAVRNQVDDFFVRFYDEQRLKHKLDTWKLRPELSNRISILESAIKHHLAGDYWCSVPTLLPQIEGLIAIAIAEEHEDELTTGMMKDCISKILNDDHMSHRAIRGFLIDQLWKRGFRHGKQIEQILNRHAILHGADVNYGTAAKSLRAILLFDALQDQIYYAKVRSKN